MSAALEQSNDVMSNLAGVQTPSGDQTSAIEKLLVGIRPLDDGAGGSIELLVGRPLRGARVHRRTEQVGKLTLSGR